VLAEPASIVEESARGLNDLYVALTRATQRLHIVHHHDLPAGMSPSVADEPGQVTRPERA
jgi:ATP-dependent exoDNAse (exonuclease V) beta subunit